MDSLQEEKGRPGGQPGRLLVWLLLSAAVGGIAVLVVSDALRRYAYAPVHQRIGAFPLMFIGAAYIVFQLRIRKAAVDLVKGLLLGLAFLFWGAEQLMPPSALVTVMDSLVITIFVVDLGLVIYEQLRRERDSGASSRL